MKKNPRGVCAECAKQNMHPMINNSSMYYCPHRSTLSIEDKNGGWIIKIGVTPSRVSLHSAAYGIS